MVVTIGSMEINLTAIWEVLTAPFAFVLRLITGRARSRRSSSPGSELKRVKLLRMAAVTGFAGAIGGVLQCDRSTVCDSQDIGTVIL